MNVMHSALSIAYPAAVVIFLILLLKVMAAALEAAAHGHVLADVSKLRRSWIERRWTRGGSPPPVPTKNRFRRKFLDDSAGSVAIEAAICLPVLLLSIAIGIDAGLAVVQKFQLQFGTSEAAIAAATNGNWQQVFAANSGGSITCTLNGPTATCQASSNYPAIFAGLLNVDTIALNATATAAVRP
jgi:hypothetical protein